MAIYWLLNLANLPRELCSKNFPRPSLLPSSLPKTSSWVILLINQVCIPLGYNKSWVGSPLNSLMEHTCSVLFFLKDLRSNNKATYFTYIYNKCKSPLKKHCQLFVTSQNSHQLEYFKCLFTFKLE